MRTFTLVAICLGIFAGVNHAHAQDATSLRPTTVGQIALPSNNVRLAQQPPIQNVPPVQGGTNTQDGVQGTINDNGSQLPTRIPSPLDNTNQQLNNNRGRTTNAATPRGNRPPRRGNPLASYSGNQRAPRSALPTVIGDFFNASSNQNVTISSIRIIPTPSAATPRFFFDANEVQNAFNNGFENTTASRNSTFLQFDDDADGNIDSSSAANVTVVLGTPLNNSQVNDFIARTRAANPGTAGAAGFSETGVMADPGGDLRAIATGRFAAMALRPGGQIVHNSLLSNSSGELFDNGSFQFTPTYAYDYVFAVQAPTPGSGGTLGRVKISDNSSPIPRDRLFFDFNFFDNAALTARGVNVHRFSPGFEKAFLGGRASVEARFPMGISLDNNVTQDGFTSSSSAEFGNITVTPKFTLFQNDRFLVSTGAGFAIPTADDLNVSFADGTRLAVVQNESLHVIPFIASVFTPNDSLFIQSFLQVDLDATGSPVFLNPTAQPGTALVNAGRLQDQTLLFADLSVGRWLFRGARPSSIGVTGVATVGEVHYNTSVQTADETRRGTLAFGDSSTTLSQVSLTVGSHLEFRRGNILTLGYVVPVGGDRQPYDGELRAYVNLFK